MVLQINANTSRVCYYGFTNKC